MVAFTAHDAVVFALTPANITLIQYVRETYGDHE